MVLLSALLLPLLGFACLLGVAEAALALLVPDPFRETRGGLGSR